MNKVIFPFKVFPYWDPPHIKDPSFWELAEISVVQANKFYETVLVCDEYTKEYFGEKLPFSKVEICNEIGEYKGKSIAIPKILAMISQKEPYIMLDMDSILFQQLPEYPNIAFGFAEVNFTKPFIPIEVLNYAMANYGQKHELDLVKENVPKGMGFRYNKIPNCSLVYVPHPEILKEIYTQILEDHKDSIEKVSPMMIEQFLIIQYLYHLDERFDWVQNDLGYIGSFEKGAYYFHWDKHNGASSPLLNMLRERYMKNPLI